MAIIKYLYCSKANFEDFASGRVLYGGKGIPNFPVRLLCEMYGRARSYLPRKDHLILYDPCCGGGYSLTTLGLCFHPEIEAIYGSDIDEEMLAAAQRNTGLLSRAGLAKRKDELTEFYRLYQKQSHADALKSCERFEQMVSREIPVNIFRADCTQELPSIAPDIIITDVPYGNLVEWEGGSPVSIDDMAEQLHRIAHEDTILAICMDKSQKLSSDRWKRLEKNNVGKRKFEILRRS